jgi:NADH-quinone oxidoreductase subunit G
MVLALLGGMSLEDVNAETLVVLDSDRLPEALLVGRRVIALDSLLSTNGARADVVLPAATFVEETGTFVSSESRMQRYYQVFVPNGDVCADWRWIGELLPGGNPWANLDALHAAIAADVPLFAPITEIAPSAEYRVDGQRVPRQTHRASGRTAINANTSVLEPAPPADPDTPLTFSMEGFQGRPPAPLAPRFWAPGWNSVQAVNKFQQEVGGPLCGEAPGRLIIESDGAGLPAAAIPSAFTPEAGAWLVLPAYHLFGSEPLSLLTPGIARLAPAPYLAMHPDDATWAGIADGDAVTFNIGGYRLTLPVALRDDVPVGAALLPAGVVDLPVALPARGTVEGGPHA